MSSTVSVSAASLAVDGDFGSCARTQASGIQTFEVFLSASDTVKGVVIHAGVGSRGFQVLVDGVEIGRTAATIGSNNLENTVPVYAEGTGPFTFLGSGESFEYSIWIESAAGVDGGYLEICEIEVFGQPSTYLAGGFENPNLAYDAFAASSVLSSSSPAASAIVDGNPLTCVRTKEGQQGILRVDLHSGAMPTSVRVSGRVLPSTSEPSTPSCEEQALGIDGAKLYVGSTVAKFEPALPIPLVSKCGESEHTRSTQQDVAETLLIVDVGENIRVCELELFVVGANGTSELFGVSALSSYVDTASYGGAQLATYATDGSTDCSPLDSQVGITLFVSIPPSLVPDRLVLHITTEVGETEFGSTSARLSTGISLGTFTSAAPGEGTIELDVSSSAQDSVSSYVTFATENVRTEVDNRCGAGGPRESAGAAYAVITSSDPCACLQACEEDSECAAWSYNRNAGHPNYRRCFLSGTVVSSTADETIDFIGGAKAEAPDSVDRFYLSNSGSYEVADLVVFDGHLPGQMLADFQTHFEQQYLYLLSGAQELPAPVINLAETFTIEGGGAQWASGVPVTWQQAEANHDTLDEAVREQLGLHPLAHALSGLNTYLVSDDLRPPCLVASSTDSAVSAWGLNPVTTEAFNDGVRRSRDSYGVEIEKMSVCRRIQTVEAALRDLDETTVCGLLTLEGENPTCQPLDLIATFTGSGVVFKWLRGCRLGDKFQVIRDGSTQIGSDFVRTVENAEGPVSAEEKQAFCTEYVEPGAVVLDFDGDLFSNRVGEEVEYCVRSIIPTDTGEVASDWRCTTLVIPFFTDVDVQVQAGEVPAPGVIVDAAVCDQDEA
eukprot:scaffold1697_cov308-Pinguiococcus_pyrenoidosus.AAC.1